MITSGRSTWWNALLVSFVLVGCGSSDKKRTDQFDAATEAAAGGNTSNTGGATGSGGSVSNTGGVSGTGGTRGSDAGQDASLGEPGKDSGADAAPVGGPLSCGSDGGKGDGGTHWRDFAAGVCRSCPAVLPRCDDFLAPGTSFDPATRVLVLHVAAGLAEIQSAQFSFVYYGPDGFQPDTTPVSAVVKGNTLTFDLSTQVPAGVTSIQGGSLQMVDACGQGGNTGAEAIDVQLTSDAGTVSVAFSCYANV